MDGDAIPCIFNPSEFTVSRSVSYVPNETPGQDAPWLQFTGGEAQTMSFSLMFDTYASQTGAPPKDVRKYTDAIMELTEVNEDTHVPYLVEFVWGPISFTGYITSITQRFILFDSDGTPVRAVVDLSLISNKKGNMTRNSPDRTKHRKISDGDRLYAIAFAEYNDCGEWRRLAEANGIDNPRILRSGDDLTVPPIL